MLGIRLSGDAEQQLAQHARDLGRPKSALARDWIVERLERESVDHMLRDAARIAAATDCDEDWIEPDLDD